MGIKAHGLNFRKYFRIKTWADISKWSMKIDINRFAI